MFIGRIGAYFGAVKGTFVSQIRPQVPLTKERSWNHLGYSLLLIKGFLLDGLEHTLVLFKPHSWDNLDRNLFLLCDFHGAI